MSIRRSRQDELDVIHDVINDGAGAYEGVIPPDRWNDPYMPLEELQQEIAGGVIFWVYEESRKVIGVMGIQELGEVTLIRHSYVRTAHRNRGIGGMLLKELMTRAIGPVLIGTWSDAVWAVAFYEKHGFRQLSRQESARLLQRYWKIPERQVETSVVLAEPRWFEQ